MSAPLPADAEVAARLRAILASREFAPHVGDDFRRRLDGWFHSIFDWLSGLSRWQRWAILAFCLASLAAVALEVWWSLRPEPIPGRERRARGAPLSGGGGERSLRRRADALAAEGRFREAARLLHEAVLHRLARERGLPWRPELSDWEWVALLPSARGLAELTRTAQRVAYGPEPGAADFAACLRHADALPEEAP